MNRPEHVVFINGWGVRNDLSPPVFSDLNLQPQVISPLSLIGQLAAGEMPALSEHSIVFGWSMGGILALDLVLRGATVKKLVLLSTTPKFIQGRTFFYGASKDSLIQLRRLVELDASRGLRSFAHRAFPVLADIMEANPDGDLLLAGLDYLASVDLTFRLEEVSVPALVLHGEADRIIPAEAGRRLAAMLPRATFGLIDSDHGIPWSQDSDLKRLIEEFVF